MSTWSRTQTIVAGLWSEGRGGVLAFVALGWALSLGVRHIFPVLFPYLEGAFHIELSALGILYTLLWMAYAVGQFPGGVLADRFGERTILVASTVLTVATVAVIGLSSDVLALVVGMLSFGLVTALYGPARFTVLTDIYTNLDGTAIGITQAAGHLGNATVPAIAGLLAAYASWRVGFLYTLPLFLAVAVGLWVVVPPSTEGRDSAAVDVSVETVRYVFGGILKPAPIRLTLVLALTMFSFQAVTSFYPTYLVEVKALSAGSAAALYGLFFACAILVQPLSGVIGDTLETRRALIAVIGLQILSLVLLPFASGLYQLIPLTVLLSSLFGATPIVIPQIARLLPEDLKGAGLGFFRTGYFLVASTGSAFVGTLAARGLFDESILLLGVPTAAGLIVVLVSVDRGGRPTGSS